MPSGATSRMRVVSLARFENVMFSIENAKKRKRCSEWRLTEPYSISVDSKNRGFWKRWHHSHHVNFDPNYLPHAQMTVVAFSSIFEPILIHRGDDPFGQHQESRPLAGPNLLNMRTVIVLYSQPIRFVMLWTVKPTKRNYVFLPNNNLLQLPIQWNSQFFRENKIDRILPDSKR